MTRQELEEKVTKLEKHSLLQSITTLGLAALLVLVL